MNPDSPRTEALSATILALLIAPSSAAPDYADDLAFLRAHTPIIELRSGDARVALAPAWHQQGQSTGSVPVIGR